MPERSGAKHSDFRRSRLESHVFGPKRHFLLSVAQCCRQVCCLHSDWSLAVFCLVMMSSVLVAQEQNPTKPVRFDLSPLIGYRTSISFPIDPHVQGTNPRVVLNASPSYGAAFG